MNELFQNIPESLSPRERWIKRHGVNTHHTPDMEEPWCAFKGTVEDIAADCALMESDGRLAYGQTLDEALANLARGLATHHRINPWNAPA